MVYMRIGGLTSGFDTENFISNVMRGERLPLDRIYQQKVRAEWQRDEYRAMNTALAGFRNLVFDMRLQSTYSTQTVSSSHDDILSVSLNEYQNTGSYSIKIDKLASAATKISADEIDSRFDNYVANYFNEQELEPVAIRLRSSLHNPDGSETEFLEVTIEETDSISDFIGKINSNRDLNINAYYDHVQNAVVLTSSNTGDNAVIEFDMNDTHTQEFVDHVLVDEQGNWDKSESGSNAEIEINGLATERENNTFDLAGIQVTLHSTAENPVRIDIVQDTDAVFTKIVEFVEQYNQMIEDIHGKLREPYHRDFPPLTDEQKVDMTEREIELWEEKSKSGLLRSDQILTNVVYDIRRSVTAPVGGIENLSSLNQIGISIGQWYENGKLYIDEVKLRTAITENPEEIMALFTNNPDDESDGDLGIARRLSQVLESGIDRLAATAGHASSLYDQSTLSEKIRGFDDKIAAMEERLITIENRYWAQFTAMERALSEMYAQSDWLYQQFMMGG